MRRGVIAGVVGTVAIAMRTVAVVAGVVTGVVVAVRPRAGVRLGTESGGCGGD